MLVLHQLLCVLFTLHGIFMHFLELTYWRDATVPVPHFLLFLCFRKVTQEIFSELDGTKPEVPISPDTRWSSKQRRRGARGWPHHAMAWVPPGCARLWCGPPWCPLTTPIRLYKASDAKTLNQSVFLPVKFHSAAAVEDQFRGTEVSVWAPCRDGEVPPEPSPSTPSRPPPSPSTLLSPMMRRE
jgi:hypothetical protein